MALLFGLGAAVPGVVGAISGDAPGRGAQRIWMLPGPIHTDIVIRYTARSDAALGFAALPEGTEWVIIGWGSEAFYTTAATRADVKLRALWAAATGDRAVLRVLPVPHGRMTSPTEIGAYGIALSARQRAALLDGIAGAVAGPAMAGVHLSPGDQFFPAKGHFGPARTCNQWVSERLRAAGLRLGFATPTKGGLRLSAWLHGHFPG